MGDIPRIILTLFMGVAGGFLGLKLRIPAGAMIGALLFVSLFNLIFGIAYLPVWCKTVLQLCTGILLGVKISKKDVIGLKKLIVPLVILLIGMVIYNVLFGTLMHLTGGLDIVTALFASAPGGMTDMTIISEDFGAESSYVVILQLVRLLTIYFAFPPLYRKMAKGHPKASPEERKDLKNTENKEANRNWYSIPGSALSGVLVGVAFWKLGVTAGALLGGMVGAAIFNLTTGRGYMPKPMGRYLRYFMGAYVGQNVTAQFVRGLGKLVIPMLVLIAGVFIFMFGLSFIMHKLSGEDRFTCMFICSPGGVQEMSMLAEDLGADAAKTALMQTARLAAVIAFFPTMIRLTASLVSMLGL